MSADTSGTLSRRCGPVRTDLHKSCADHESRTDRESASPFSVRNCVVPPELQAELDAAPPPSCCECTEGQCCSEGDLESVNQAGLSLSSACSCAMQFDLPFDLRVEISLPWAAAAAGDGEATAPTTTAAPPDGCCNDTGTAQVSALEQQLRTVAARADSGRARAPPPAPPYDFAAAAAECTMATFGVPREAIRSNDPNPDGRLNGKCAQLHGAWRSNGRWRTAFSTGSFGRRQCTAATPCAAPA